MDDLNLQAQDGQLICLLGPNGAGKSTLLRTLAGLQPVLGGSVSISGHDLATLTPNERAKLMAMVLTENQSMETTTVGEVVALGRYPYLSFLGGLTEQDQALIDSRLCQMGINANRLYNALSDGEKQRVLIAKALVQQTPLILLDEPTAHLDLPSRIRTMMLLRSLAHDEHKCIVISTHELDLALRTADTIWLMTDRLREGDPQLIKPDICQAFGLAELGYRL